MASEADIANRIPITGALMLATLMNTLDSTIANVALPHMQGSLSASQDQATWVLTSYILATAIMTPLSGWLSLKIGRKPMLLISITAFTAASMLCGVAQNLPEMVLFRFLQGIAGASVMPLSQTVMLDVYPQRLIPTVMSLWSATVILGPIIGPAARRLADRELLLALVLLHQRADRRPGHQRHLRLHGATTAADCSDHSTSWDSARWSPSSPASS